MAGISKAQREERERLAGLGLKQCSVKAGCGEVKSVDEFGLKKDTWDGLCSICRICVRNNNKKYYKKNPEARKAYSRQYHLNNLEARNAYSRQHYLNNLEERREYGREYHAEKYREDPMYYRLHLGKKRAKEAGVEWDDISSTDLLNYWKQNNISTDTCHYCKQTIDEGDLHLDHGIPIIRGGSHTLDNLFPCHGRCNREKFNKTVEEYLEHLK